ncbi:MAG: AraC family transcriptional regulator [Pseudoclavibacter sp.]
MATIDEPLAGFELFRTRDPLEAQASAERITAPHRLRIRGRATQFAAAFDAVELGAATLGVIRYGADISIERPGFDGFVAVLMPLVGRLSIELNRHEHVAEPERSMVVLSPRQGDAKLTWAPGTVVMALKVETEDLTRALRWIAPDADDSPFVASSPLVNGSPWRVALGTAQLFADVVARTGSRGPFPRPLARQLREQVVTTMWLSVPNNHTDDIHRLSGTSKSPAVQQAIDLIAAEDRAEYTVPDLARAVHIGVRALEMGFRREVDETPLHYLQRARLERANDDLRNLGPSDATVTEIAQRWGFDHLGRFAARYRVRFGELPSETLGARPE